MLTSFKVTWGFVKLRELLKNWRKEWQVKHLSFILEGNGEPCRMLGQPRDTGKAEPQEDSSDITYPGPDWNKDIHRGEENNYCTSQMHQCVCGACEHICNVCGSRNLQ